MSGENKEREALERWSASLAQTPGLAEVMATGDVALIGAFILESFRVTLVDLAEETEGLKRVRQMALGSLFGRSRGRRPVPDAQASYA